LPARSTPNKETPKQIGFQLPWPQLYSLLIYAKSLALVFGPHLRPLQKTHVFEMQFPKSVLNFGLFEVKEWPVYFYNLPFGHENASSAPIWCSKLKSSNDDSKAASQCELAAVDCFILARFNAQLSAVCCYQSVIKKKVKINISFDLNPIVRSKLVYGLALATEK